MSLFGGGGDSGWKWTIATLLIVGMMIALFVGHIAAILQDIFTSMLGPLGEMYYSAQEAFNRTPANSTIKVYNETVTVPEPGSTEYRRAAGLLYSTASLILTALSDPRILAVVISITLVLIALMYRPPEL